MIITLLQDIKQKMCICNFTLLMITVSLWSTEKQVLLYSNFIALLEKVERLIKRDSQEKERESRKSIERQIDRERERERENIDRELRDIEREKKS